MGRGVSFFLSFLPDLLLSVLFPPSSATLFFSGSVDTNTSWLLSGDHSTREPLTGRVFVSHGRNDAVLTFGVAERRARSYADRADVLFVPFDGGHTLRPIEPAFVQWLRETFAD